MQGIRKAMAWLVVPFTAAVIGIAALASSPAQAATQSGQIESLQNPAQCLDNSNFGWHVGNTLQMWSCGASGGQDQQFTYDNSTELLHANQPATAQDQTTKFCVDSSTQGAALTIQACNASDLNQQVIVFDNVYEFLNSGLVIDARGRSVANGSVVQGWLLNDGKNQQYTLPVGP